MFHSARIKLTAWYLLIIMLISLSFSVAIYKVLTAELDRVESIQRLRLENGPFERPQILPPDIRDETFRQFRLDPQLINETKDRLFVILTFINLAILGSSTVAGYFLAGRTLKPIKEMVDDQNHFVTDASHELRTPLTSLKSEIEVNLRDKNLNLSQAKKLLTSNLEEVNNLQALSDGLIKLTQYQKGYKNLNVGEVSLASVVSDAVKKVINLAKNKKLSIINEVGDYKFSANRESLAELFVILLDNAVKYSPSKTKVTLTSQKTDGYLEVKIADQGYGIGKEDLPHLFDRFQRAEKSRSKAKASGYGLGLAIAKRIVDSHHGTIKVRSELNKGSVFTVQLPKKRLNKII